ncbi:hypothetical protein [Desulfoprunum benzoelyticum]|uniref:hypothetical protein n=1 Tax=Desulfoprunum benzoelyticum TaxID=1506996 RepID=UPI0016213BFC|nr:hypothetical protein [Desulfoprunum benzoelyticum]
MQDPEDHPAEVCRQQNRQNISYGLYIAYKIERMTTRQDKKPEIEIVKMKTEPVMAALTPVDFQIILKKADNEGLTDGNDGTVQISIIRKRDPAVFHNSGIRGHRPQPAGLSQIEHATEKGTHENII